jgi:hypothetical protein
MPDSTATRARMADRNVNPAPVSGRSHLQLNLVGVGKQLKPEDIFDALITLYGAGKVTSPHLGGSHDVINLEIRP